jgi:hypothetical protein
MSLETMLSNNTSMEVICQYQTLEPGFIDDHDEFVDWYIVCQYQILLPEWLMRKHVDKLNWGRYHSINHYHMSLSWNLRTGLTC